jgi:hypothetical protein
MTEGIEPASAPMAMPKDTKTVVMAARGEAKVGAVIP